VPLEHEDEDVLKSFSLGLVAATTNELDVMNLVHYPLLLGTDKARSQKLVKIIQIINENKVNHE